VRTWSPTLVLTRELLGLDRAALPLDQGKVPIKSAELTPGLHLERTESRKMIRLMSRYDSGWEISRRTHTSEAHAAGLLFLFRLIGNHVDS
jgi:hypothetical protein